MRVRSPSESKISWSKSVQYWMYSKECSLLWFGTKRKRKMILSHIFAIIFLLLLYYYIWFRRYTVQFVQFVHKVALCSESVQSIIARTRESIDKFPFIKEPHKRLYKQNHSVQAFIHSSCHYAIRLVDWRRPILFLLFSLTPPHHIIVKLKQQKDEK